MEHSSTSSTDFRLMHRQLPSASSSAVTLVTHPFASSSATLVPSSIDAAAGLGLKCRKASDASLGSHSDEDQTSETSPSADAHIGAFKPPGNVTRALLPLRVVGNLAIKRPKNGAQRNKKTETILHDTLEIQSLHADDIPPASLAVLRNKQARLEKEAKSLQKERNAALEGTSGWYNRQCIKYTAQEAEDALYIETKKHYKKTRWVSELAMRAKVDRAIEFNESSLDKGKARARDDSNLSRKMPNPFRSSYAS